MAITLDTTLNGTKSNSYCTVAYADDYFFNHWDTVKAAAWDALGFPQKTYLLVMACRLIETVKYTNQITIDEFQLFYDRRSGMILELDQTKEPVKYTYIQKLQFPRNLDRDYITGVVYIPEEIMMAQCEQAIYLTTYDETAVANRTKGIVNDTVGLGNGDLHLNQEYVSDGSAFAPMALEFVRPYMIKSGSKLRRG